MCRRRSPGKAALVVEEVLAPGGAGARGGGGASSLPDLLKHAAAFFGGGARRDRHEADDGPPVAGEDDVIAAFGAPDQLAQLLLGFVEWNAHADLLPVALLAGRVDQRTLVECKPQVPVGPAGRIILPALCLFPVSQLVSRPS
jgi:hypothetical protein